MTDRALIKLAANLYVNHAIAQQQWRAVIGSNEEKMPRRGKNLIIISIRCSSVFNARMFIYPSIQPSTGHSSAAPQTTDHNEMRDSLDALVFP